MLAQTETHQPLTTKESLDFHYRVGCIITNSMDVEQSECLGTVYLEQADRKYSNLDMTKRERKIALYKLNKCNQAIKAIMSISDMVKRELRPTTKNSEGEKIVQDAIDHHSSLFADLINLDYQQQIRVNNLIQKIKREALK